MCEIGNQQERSVDYAWLSAMLEAEGSISFQVYTLPDGRIRITPYLCFVNSDPLLLAEVKRLLDELTMSSSAAKPRWCRHGSDCSVIRLDGVAVKFVLEPLMPYFRGAKRKNAEILLAYLESRSGEKMLKRDASGRLIRIGYSPQQIDMICSVRTHSRRKSSESIRQAPNIVR